MKPSKIKATRWLDYRRMSAFNADDMRALQILFESSFSYFMLVHGTPPRPNAAYSVLRGMPKVKAKR